MKTQDTTETNRLASSPSPGGEGRGEGGLITPTTLTPQSASMGSRRFPIAGDTIAKATAELPDDQRASLRWFADHCRRQNLTVQEAAGLVIKPNGEPYSYDSLYAAFTGRRDHASMDNLSDAIAKFRRRIEESSPRTAGEFIETALTKKVWSYCRKAFDRHRVGFIFGPSQIGKTMALASYQAAHNHGETKLVRMPTRGSLSDFMNELAAINNISTQSKHADRRRRIIECFDEKTLLIVDECHQCMIGHYSERALASLEFVREIVDRRKCGAVLCGTDVFRDELVKSKVLRQLLLRGMPPLQLPVISTPSDLRAIAEAFELPEIVDKLITIEAPGSNGRMIKHTDNPAQLQKEINEKFGLGRWCAILQEAQDIAKERHKRNSWGYVIFAHTQFEAMGHFAGGEL